MKLSIVGTGYVGLVTGVCLAEKGHDVVCVDVDAGRVESINRGRSPIYEAGLPELLDRHIGRRFRAVTNLRDSVLNSEVTFLAVGTPYKDDAIDLTAVLLAARQVGEVLRDKSDYHVVVVKSTVVPGTTDSRVVPVLEESSDKSAGVDFGVGMNPEFLSEGEAIHDFLHPDRLVLGSSDARTAETLERIYEPFTETPRVHTNLRTAEMIKYASNALLATLISFSNELANLGATLGGVDTVDVTRGVALSQYFSGRNADGLPPIVSFLRAGCGYGGSCLPKDVSALVAHGRRVGESMLVLDAVQRTNVAQPRRTVDLVRKHWVDLRGVRVAVLGLSFKPGTNDVRESPALPIIRELVAAGAIVSVFDPIAMNDASTGLGDAKVRFGETLEDTISDAQAVVVVTPWKAFGDLPALLRARSDDIVLVDARRAFDRQSVIRYEGIGL